MFSPFVGNENKHLLKQEGWSESPSQKDGANIAYTLPLTDVYQSTSKLRQ